ncbi:MAG: hypothetical protein DDT26_00766 [Dehalococcoidia bacterium]|nr:hypothetical protein [Chloroflexota bacterium]
MKTSEILALGWLPSTLRSVFDFYQIPLSHEERTAEQVAFVERLVSYPPSPRGASTYKNDRIEIDLNRLDLGYGPMVQPPEWQPERAIKPWADIEPQIAYFDIETTGLAPSTSAAALLTPTAIASELGWLYSTGNPDPRRVNAALERLGYQTKIGGKWTPTALGEPFAQRQLVTIANKASDVDQMLWRPEVVAVLQERGI